MRFISRRSTAVPITRHWPAAISGLSALILFSLLASGASAQSRPAGEATCGDCHPTENSQFGNSIHASAGINCQSCHGGQAIYSASAETIERLRQRTSTLPATAGPSGSSSFDHGPDFLGRPTRRQIPERCGSCHSDVTKMNPYGLPTDQLAQYRTSGHGKALSAGNERVAVCTDCHGRHEILGPKNPASSVYARNVPATCGHCHENPLTMAGTQLSTRVPAEYRQSVHGQGLLEAGDLAMPNCAGCHGSHSAVPPGFREVGHVCGRCHQQEQQNFLQSPHAKFPLFPMCVACHTRSVDERDHRIERVVASPDSVEKAYLQALTTMPADGLEDATFKAAYAAHRQPPVSPFQSFCQRCHARSREMAHRVFFEELDIRAAEMGGELYDLVQHAELRYASTTADVNRVRHGILLVSDESLLVDEMKTRLLALAPLQHTLDVDKVKAAVADMDQLAGETDRSLGNKLRALAWRYRALIPIWIFLLVFVPLLWVKYERLRAAMVQPLSSSGDADKRSGP